MPSQASVTLVPRGQPGAQMFAWIWRNLFGSLANSVLTIAVIWILYQIITGVFRWAVIEASVAPATLRDCIDAGGACWAFIQNKWRLILFGTYPYDEQWRPASALLLFAVLVVASCARASWRTAERRRWLFAAWLVGLPAIAVLMAGGLWLDYVDVRLWSGLPLTVMLAVIGMAACFVVSILLALGRRSSMPVIRWICIIYIEVVRGVPLISLLFMANILLPILLPSDITIPNIVRAQLAFIIFFSAYMAETVRGGLQAVPEGQYAAAKAMGMNYWQTMHYIILPQALHISIPSMVNLFIAGFKDTSLVIVISMLDLLGTANAAKADPEWLGLFIEAYVFVGAIYLTVCTFMSWYSRRLERSLATRQRQ